MSKLPNPLDVRQSDHPIEELFLKRWSPRAMNGEGVEASIMDQLFEAARWAPSTYNEQEWRFLYSHRESPSWETFFGLLAEANQSWCDKAGVLVVVASRTTFSRNGKPNPVHEFDAGLATQNLLLQAAQLGIVAHPMAGYDRGKAKIALEIPDGFETHCMIAIGHPGNPEALPEQMRQNETPTGRKTIDKIAKQGEFAFED
ncbi:nitroreductase family protein [Thalassoglobus sp. JC818]|uniref:nitroreductase family protein n=1 Tax=Thalassoglobus sp. JC818 TaxID=3232136 RepID=UPI003458DEFF